MVSLVLLARAAASQMVRPESYPTGFILLVEDPSQGASASKPIHFASGANSWDPGDPAYRLEPRSDKRWQIVFKPDQLGENVEFKFTLGGWESVELDADGQQISNRQLPAIDASTLAPGEKPVIELVVPQWNDGSQEYVIAFEYRPLEVTGTVKRLEVSGGAGLAEGSMRDLLVWLPPGYGRPENAERSYPVLYMMDGQNLFQDHAFIPGEWRADETAQALIGAQLAEPFIIVGVPHDGNDRRLSEYLPPNAALPASMRDFEGEAAGDDQVRWLTAQVMPRVERAFRVKTDRLSTGVGGASAGGTFAIYAAMTAPERFGLVLAESPYLPAIRDEMWSEWAQTVEGDRRVFLGMGGREQIEGSEFFDPSTMEHVGAIEKAAQFFGRALGSDVALSIVGRHRHNEHAWAERFPMAVMHLFGVPTGGVAIDDADTERGASARAPTPTSTPAPAPAPEMEDPQRLEQGFTLVMEDASGEAGDGPVYFAGNLNNWNAEDGDRTLTRRDDGTWVIDIAPGDFSQRIEFKFTLGGWGRVEVNPDGSETDNRTLPMVDVSRLEPGEKPVIRMVVPRFRSPEDAAAIERDFDPTADWTGDIRRVLVAGGGGRAAEMERELLVWLPPGYGESGTRTYPVLYLLDGQNVFAGRPGVPDEWHADETATALVESGAIEPLVIVAVPNAGRYRGDEYLPFEIGLSGTEPDGPGFLAWLTGTVMPSVEGRFRVDHARERTGIGGASLGGLFAAWAGVTEADRFGLLLIESCSRIGGAEGMLRSAMVEAKASGAPAPERVVIGMGDREVSRSPRDSALNAGYRGWAGALGEGFLGFGVSESDLKVVVGEGQSHDEGAWGERFGAALRFLAQPQ